MQLAGKCVNIPAYGHSKAVSPFRVTFESLCDANRLSLEGIGSHECSLPWSIERISACRRLVDLRFLDNLESCRSESVVLGGYH